MKTRFLLFAAVALGLLSAATAPWSRPEAKGYRRVHKRCPSCQRNYPVAERYCALDGSPLLAWEWKDQPGGRCPRCGRNYAHPARFCSLDGARLKITLPEDPLPEDAGKELERTVPRKSQASTITSREEPSPLAPQADDPTRLVGSAYLSALRYLLLAVDDEKENRSKQAEELEQTFDQVRRVVVAIRCSSTDGQLRGLAARMEQDLRERLEEAGLRDLQLVSPEEIVDTPGARQILCELVLSRALPDQPRLKFQLLWHDKRQEKSWVGPTVEAESQTTEALEGDRLNEVTHQLALATTRYLNWLAYERYDAGLRLARRGDSEEAVEEFAKFLFRTPDFNAPQAEKANQYVITQLRFSVLDWLWGEPQVACVDQGPPDRRLPLGFRPVPGSSFWRGLPRTIVCLRDGTEMVLVPSAEAMMGRVGTAVDERPEHQVALGAFYIDKWETSVEQYERFVLQTGHRAPWPEDASEPAQWLGRTARPGVGHLPVVQVSWHDAMAYAQWAGKTLPAEAQWERAARGEFAADHSPALDPGDGWHAAVRTPAGQLMSVYSFPRALSPYGCQNVLGNVAEWCRDWYASNYYQRSPRHDPPGPDFGELRVVRGGSFKTPRGQLSTTRRDALAPTTRRCDLGFRCVLNLPGEW